MQQELSSQGRCLFYFSKRVYDYLLKLGVALKLHSERDLDFHETFDVWIEN